LILAGATLLKPYGDAHILIAVNVDTANAAVKLQFEQRIETVETVFESPPPLAVGARGLSDRFRPEEVKIYRIVFAKP
jgi:hypothetical protein